MRKFAFRRTAVVGAIWVGLLGVLATVSPSASGQEAVEPGKGNAYALGFKVDPRAGQLSVGVAYGESLAGHQNGQAIAEARSLNLGIIGTTLAAEGCDGGDPTLPKENQPHPLVARTDDEESKQKSDSDLGVDRDVSVAGVPLALARATVAGGGQADVLNIGATTTETRSGLIDGRRLARATTKIASVDIGGVLELTGLRWVAEYQTEPDEATVTDFSIDGIKLAGTSIPLLNAFTTQVFDSIAEANSVLELFGIRISTPKGRVASGIAFVDPLRISVIPDDARDGILGGVLDALQPGREEGVKLINEVTCKLNAAITVADIVVGSITGAGSFNLELGGVTASSADIDVFQFPGFEAPGPAPAAPAAPAAPSAPQVGAGPNISSPSSAPATTTDTDTSSNEESDREEVAAPVAESRPLSGVRGGPLLYTGLAGLLLLGLLAEGDRRKMRKAQRSTPTTSGG